MTTGLDPDVAPQQVATRLLQLLSNQLALYRQLACLAKQQSLLVNNNDPQQLLEVLGTRQCLVDQLLAIGQQLTPVKERWRQCQNELPDEARGKAQLMLDEVGCVLTEIIASDERDSAALAARKEDIGSQIRRTTTGKQVNQAYKAQAGPRQKQRG